MAKVTQLGFIEDDTIGTPPTNIVNIYAKSDKLLYFKNDVGVELPIGTGSGSGSVVSVTSANGDITITNPSTNPVLTVVETPSTRALESATTTVNVDSATAPTAGQVLTATSSTSATWQNGATAGPSFSATIGSPFFQTIAVSTTAIVKFDVEEWDTDNCFDTSTYSFTPNKEGYYQINVFIQIGTQVGFGVYIKKNGSDFKSIGDASPDSDGSFAGSVLLYLNGTTDVVNVQVNNNSVGSIDIFGNPVQSTFSGFFVRGV